MSAYSLDNGAHLIEHGNPQTETTDLSFKKYLPATR